jgi:UV DNA damage endonuclease
MVKIGESITMRIGFAVKVLGEGGLKECDARRWQNGPHLLQSIAYLREIFHYLDRNDLRMYRMSSDLAPYLTHPDLPQFHNQIEESAKDLAELGELACRYRLRLSMHPSQYIVLNAVDDEVARKSREELIGQAALLDAMGLGPEAVVVTHVGGVYGDKQAGIERFARRYEALPENARRRLVVENDDVSYSASDALKVHDLCGIRMVFDNLHHLCNNPEGPGYLSLRQALERALATWPEDQMPKIHYSSPRTEAVERPRKNGKAGAMRGYGVAPDLRLHADYINPFEFRYFLEKAEGLRPFDVMVEAKAKDLAAIKLRKDLAAYFRSPL